MVYFIGTNNNDVLIGTDDKDTFYGQNGDDFIYGGDGNDYIDGGNGNDTLYGGNGNDTLYGREGNDILDGGAGNDQLNGGEGNNLLMGGEGNDTLSAGDKGGNTLIGGKGDDTLYGGDGDDTFYIGNNDGHDYLSDYRGNNILVFNTALNDATFSMKEGNLIIYYEKNSKEHSVTIDKILLKDFTQLASIRFTDQIINSEQLLKIAVTLNGGSYIQGANDNNMLLGSNKDDLIYDDTSTGDNLIVAGEGNDSIFSYRGDDTIIAGGGNDFIRFKNGQKTIMAGKGDDNIYGSGNSAVIYGEEGNDYIRTTGINCTIDGGEGNDTITGGSGNSLLMGGEGDDVIYAGRGNNTIYGGSGNDTIDLSYTYGFNNLVDGGSGNDTYLSHWMDANMIIDDKEGQNIFVTNVKFEEVKLTIKGNDLIMKSFQGHEVTLKGFMLKDYEMGSNYSQIIFNNADEKQYMTQQELIKAAYAQQIEGLISTMAGFNIPASATTNMIDDQPSAVEKLIAVNV